MSAEIQNKDPDLVDRNMLLSRCKNIRKKYEDSSLTPEARFLSSMNDVIYSIETATSVKASVPKGIWRYQKLTVPKGGGQTYFRWSCTHCKNKFIERSNYCPNCGAKMTTEKRV